MTNWMNVHLDDHRDAVAGLGGMLPKIQEVGQMLQRSFAAGGHLYTFGNGGSAADAQHFSGELIGRYQRNRHGLPALTLSTDPTVMSCIANDFDYADVFARQVSAVARKGDVVAAFSTSGRSANIVNGLRAAQDNGAATILFGGADGGRALKFANFALLAPSTKTPRIQEMHTFMLHVISEFIDVWALETEVER